MHRCTIIINVATQSTSFLTHKIIHCILVRQSREVEILDGKVNCNLKHHTCFSYMLSLMINNILSVMSMYINPCCLSAAYPLYPYMHQYHLVHLHINMHSSKDWLGTVAIELKLVVLCGNLFENGNYKYYIRYMYLMSDTGYRIQNT